VVAGKQQISLCSCGSQEWIQNDKQMDVTPKKARGSPPVLPRRGFNEKVICQNGFDAKQMFEFLEEIDLIC